MLTHSIRSSVPFASDTNDAIGDAEIAVQLSMTTLLLLVVVEIVDVSVANDAVMVETWRTRAVVVFSAR